MKMRSPSRRYRVQAPSTPTEKWKVVNVVDPRIVGLYDTEEEAEAACNRLNRGGKSRPNEKAV